MKEKIIEILKDNKEWNSSLEYTADQLLILFGVSGSFIVNGFAVTQQKNLHPSMLSWSAKHLSKGITFCGKTKKECVSWSENYH